MQCAAARAFSRHAPLPSALVAGLRFGRVLVLAKVAVALARLVLEARFLIGAGKSVAMWGAAVFLAGRGSLAGGPSAGGIRRRALCLVRLIAQALLLLLALHGVT